MSLRNDPVWELSVLREAQDRVLEREGIPMVLALVSEIGPPPTVSDEGVRSEGRRLAGEMDCYRAALLSQSRDGDMGCVASILQAVSYADFGVLSRRLPEPAQPVMRQEV